VAADLKKRLARIRASKADDASFSKAKPSAAPPERPRPPFLEGWEKSSGYVWKRTIDRDNPLPNSIDPGVFAPLRRSKTISPNAPRVSTKSLRFFDLETTGLSGGTGTIAFLASIGRIGESGDFSLSQIFLEDFPGERGFIETVLDLLGEGTTIVSYNGKAFDLPLLRTRCVMNALEAPALGHIDALFASRRLWKTVHGGASLSLLERAVLDIEREEDIPGAMIPDIWLSFARTGEGPLMHLVLSHNADDVVSLAKLVSRAQAIFDDPLSRVASCDVDRFGLGRSLIAVGRDAEGEELLEAAAGEGNEKAGLMLLARYRRTGRVAEGLDILPLLPATYRAAVEKAKFYERCACDLDNAETWAKEAQALAQNENERSHAERRCARIKKRI
jgi:uncharacterized protein